MEFYHNFKQNIDAISICLKKGFHLAALTLMYSSIDIIAWMAFGDINVEDRFTNWIDQWMYKNRELEATSTDLYAARCSILHTLTPDSSLSKRGKANIVTYAWGTADINHLKEVAQKRGIKDQSFVHIVELFELFQEGISEFMSELDTNEDMQKGFTIRASMSYENISAIEMEGYREE